MATSGRFALPDVNFHTIRPAGSPPSRAGGFEELASIVLRDSFVSWPDGTIFRKFGNPDGGREGKGTLPDGDVWAWQAKYLFAFGTDEISQVDKSVKRVLDTEPQLRKYYVVLPYDLPAGDSPDPKPRKSAATRWTEKVSVWKALAAERGSDVQFIYVGAHELLVELTKSEHAGRVRYWFDAAVLSEASLGRRIDEVIEKVGRRYSPKLHVDVEPVRALDGLGRSENYVNKVQIALAGVRKAGAERWLAPKEDQAVFEAPLADCIAALSATAVALTEFLEAARTTGRLPEAAGTLELAADEVSEVYSLLRDRHLIDHRYYTDIAASLFTTVTRTQEALWAAISLMRSTETEAARTGQLLVIGRSGVGKTHLFCDVAQRRNAAGLPTLVVLGQDFDTRPLLAQIGELVQLDGSLDDVLAVFDAAGQASSNFAMLMIDAINEGANAQRWADELRVLDSAVRRHHHVVLAVSCRTEFLRPVIGDFHRFPLIEHTGFDEATSEAIIRYTREYALEALTFPVLNPEYGNPLFLKLACEALATLGQTRFTLGAAGLATVCSAFLEAVDRRLAAETRCDYDEETALAQRVVRELATLGPGPYEREAVKELTDALLPFRAWSKSLLQGLLREGVLVKRHDERLMFGYQRLGDVARALLLVERPRADLSAWYASLGEEGWKERGTLGALAVIVPERLNEELIDLLKDEEGRTDWDVIDAFVEGLALRDPVHTTARTARIAEQIIGSDGSADRVWETIIRVACVPGHTLNAEWAHNFLSVCPLPDRDATWSEWLVNADGNSGDHAVSTLLDWAWNPRTLELDTTPLPAEIAHLATLIFAWFLTTPDRRIRDRATKALVSIGERGPTGFTDAVKRFRGCNDPYVVERLSAALCALALRSREPAVILETAEAATELIADRWPAHLLTRDYLRRVAAAARNHGWSGPSWESLHKAEWPTEARSHHEIEAMTKPPSGYYPTWKSIEGAFGDFGRYVLEPAVESFDTPDHEELCRLVERVIFTRILELGWTPEQFKELEAGRSGDRDDHVERYGKKYQWIALYESLGRLTDNYKIKEKWERESQPFDYEYPEQIVYRDIDPTVLRPGGFEDQKSEAPSWFLPVYASFPDEAPLAYPADLDGVPDPLDLISLTALDGKRWLSLIRHCSWTQVLPPEVAALGAHNLDVWMQIRGYLVRVGEAESIGKWAVGKDWYGRWMPDNAEIHNRLLAAHPGSPDWDLADGSIEPLRGNVVLPASLYQPVAFYGGTGTSRESASTAEPTGYVPSRMLCDLLDLQHGKDFAWADTEGMAIQDPTAGMSDFGTLVVRRDLMSRLVEKGYTVFWTVLLNKQRIERGNADLGPDYQWINASAAYLLSNHMVELLSADASIQHRGGAREPNPVEWQLRRTG
ncbi:NACHT domain-containing protein [Nocardia sp. NPDC057227]|uniref:NACHT domain-containing protein n=1 Tax=Nocardia sp. NPDC057227 TaxID=3346056 RepID=UPI003644D32D